MDSTPRVRLASREVPLTPFTFVKSPATSPAALGQPTRRGVGLVNPILDSPARKHFGNTSTLNLFADPNSEDPNVSPSPRRIRGIADHNLESPWTQEWSKSCVKHVPPPAIIERGKGLKIVAQKKGDVYQHTIHVVGSSLPPAPETPGRGIRCHSSANAVTPNRVHEDVMGQLLQFDPAILSDVERRNAPKRPPLKSHQIDRMQQLRVVVADHVLHRKGGIASFYVALTRGMVGNLQSVPQTPRSLHYELSSTLLNEERRQLTLESLRDQLEALTRCEMTLRELADVLWDMVEVECNEAVLGSCPVSFHDFAKTFATVGDNPMLKAHKF